MLPLSLSLSLSLSLIPGRGRAGHHPNPFQVAPEASRIGCEGVSWPGVPPGVIVMLTLVSSMPRIHKRRLKMARSVSDDKLRKKIATAHLGFDDSA